MTKTICDICGKEMPTPKFVDDVENMNFCMSSHGKIWDICYACRLSLNGWMTRRRREGDSIRYCSKCVHSNGGLCAGTEVCHECMWNNQFAEAIKTVSEDKEGVEDANEN